MNNKNLLLIAFIFLAVVQLYVPAHRIFSREEILDSGSTYKFDVAPVDPYDPFRGKYIRLRYTENSYGLQEGTQWERNESIYVSFARDKNGFAKIQAVSKEMPEGNDYVKAKVASIFKDHLIIDYPFDRLYMEESKAYEAELLYRETLQDSSQLAYALVHIKAGKAVLEDVYIHDTPLKDLVDKR